MSDLNCKLEAEVVRICAERGIPLAQGRAAFVELLSVLHEIIVKAESPESINFQVYSALGSEATFHFAGLFYDTDVLGEMLTELELINPSIKGFRSTRDRWEYEAYLNRKLKRDSQEDGEPNP